MDETWQSGKITAVIAGLKTEITEGIGDHA
jgi:hypothetical protein